MNVDAHQWQDHFLELDLIDRAQTFMKMALADPHVRPILGEKPVVHHYLAAFRTSKSFCVIRQGNRTNVQFLARSRG
jgi:hypothetical protein